nr:TonB-dependent receptor [Rhodoblastus sphagnicola]
MLASVRNSRCVFKAFLACGVATSVLSIAAPAFSQSTVLPDVDVAADRLPSPAPVSPVSNPSGAASPAKEGSVENGYRASSASVGALGAKSLKDTPYSINVASRELITNLQAQTASEAVKYNPTVYAGSGNNMVGGGAAFTIRGFTTDTNQSFIDGLRIYSRTPLEDKERIEVLNGPSALLFGFTNPAGVINYVQKRPTAEPFANMTVGDYGGAQGYVHGDFGGPLDQEGRFAYRLNLLYVGKGDVGVNDDSHERYLASGALDWHISPGTIWSLDFEHFYINVAGGDNIFTIGSNVTAIPKAPSASKNYMPTYSIARDAYDRVATRISSELSDSVTLRGAVSYSNIDMYRHRASDKIIDNAGDFTMSRNYYHAGKQAVDGNAYLDIKFDTWDWRHKATVGVNEEYSVVRYAYPYANGTVNYKGTNNLYHPFAWPADTSADTVGDPNRDTDRANLFAGTIADQVSFNDQWSLIGGLTWASINDQAYVYSATKAGAYTTIPEYQQSRVSPSVALLYKMLPEVSLYVSYNEALQKGPTSPSTGVTNPNVTLAPYVARGVEGGLKATAGMVDINAALFRIEQAYAFTNSASLYVQSGVETHVGGEFVATGKLTENFTVTGGFTVLQASVDDVTVASINGKVPVGVPQHMARLYGEYALPLPGLTLTGGVSYNDSVYANAANTLSVPAVTTGDLGLRYATRIEGYDTTFRFNVQNITNTNYWTVSSSSLALGAPRTFAFSASMKF